MSEREVESYLLENQRGQLTIFIIIGIVIVGGAILVYLFYPNIKSNLRIEAESPSSFMENCLEEDVMSNLEIMSNQGGSLNPEHYVIYEDEKIEYLCYTEEYYKTCIMQRPMLKDHIEEELKKSVEQEVSQCLQDLKKAYQNRGYNVNLQRAAYNVELLPKRIVFRFNDTLTLTKDGSDKYESLEIIFNNNIYELTSITRSILNWESTYGDAETTIYMNYYRDLKVEKKKQSDGTTIYILTDRNNQNKFQFASRSVAWPPGYGASGVK